MQQVSLYCILPIDLCVACTERMRKRRTCTVSMRARCRGRDYARSWPPHLYKGASFNATEQHECVALGIPALKRRQRREMTPEVASMTGN